MDKIIIKNARYQGNIGVTDPERADKQEVAIDVTLFFDTNRAATTDEIDHTINYSSVNKLIREIIGKKEYKLIELLGEEIATAILNEYPATRVELLIKKPYAIKNADYAAVEIIRNVVRAYIGFGSNIGDREKSIKDALDAISKGCKVIAHSSLYETEPVGYKEQGLFLNSVACIETTKNADELRRFLKEIEDRLGRVRTIRNGPRTIDLDILLYGNEVINEEYLVVPHPEVQNRLFVLEPLNEIAPTLIHPVLKKKISQILKEVQHELS